MVMTRGRVRATLIALLLVLAAFAAPLGADDGPAPQTQQQGQHRYVCPMREHTAVFDKPGDCPECGMALVEKESLDHKNVAILIFDNVKTIDFAPEFEIFSQAGYNVYTVAPEKRAIRTVYGLEVTPDYDLAGAPPAEILILPGGGVHQASLPAPWAHGLPVPDDPRILAWVKRSAQGARIVLSVCNGAYTLARAGLLDGRSATTTRNLVAGLAQAGRGITPVENRRWVEDGKFVTSGGESAGMDGSYHVLAMLEGEDAARRHARGLEYRWDPAGDDRREPAR